MKKQNNSKLFWIKHESYQNLFIILFLVCFSIIFNCASKTFAVPQQHFNENDTFLTSSIDEAKEKYFIESLKKYLGIPYLRGGATEKGFDCSGFVRKVYMEYFGIDLPHGSKSQSLLAIMQEVAEDKLITGDLIFFSTTGNKKINHVGMYLSEGLFIHAARHGVTISSLDDSYWKTRFAVAKRISNTDIWAGIAVEESKGGSLLAMYDEPFNREIDNLPFFPMNGQFEWSIVDEKPLKRNGMKFAAAFGVEEKGLFLTPSLIYNDIRYGKDAVSQGFFTYGIDLEISPLGRSWQFAMGMRYSEYAYSDTTTAIGSWRNFLSPVSLSFAYLHKINKSANFSIAGEVIQRYGSAPNDWVFDPRKIEQRSMLLFNYKY